MKRKKGFRVLMGFLLAALLMFPGTLQVKAEEIVTGEEPTQEVLVVPTEEENLEVIEEQQPEIFEEVKKEEAIEALLPLIRGNIENIAKKGFEWNYLIL